MLRRAILLLTVLMICFHACSCVSDYTYTTCIVEITPTPTGFDRQMTMYRTEVADSTRTRVALELEPKAADRLEGIYGVRPMTASADSGTAEADSADTVEPYVGRGSFTAVPNDLNNWGTLRALRSTLGTSWLYGERIGGEPDAAGRLQKRFAAVDSLTDHLLGWSEWELGWHPRWPALRAGIGVDLRRTLRNIVLDGVRPDSGRYDRFLLASFEQPLSLMTVSILPPGEMDASVADWLLQELRLHMAQILELRSPAEVDRVLHHVSHPDSTRRSFARYFARATGMAEEDALRPDVNVFEFLLAGDLFYSDDQRDSLVVRLLLPPGIHDLESNAVRDSAVTSLAWSGWLLGLPNPASEQSFACWATWVQPDSAMQVRLFGEVELDEDELTSYCMWINTLDAKHQAEWNKMLGRLRPGKTRPLERFRFSDAKRDEEERIPGRDLLLHALD